MKAGFPKPVGFKTDAPPFALKGPLGDSCCKILLSYKEQPGGISWYLWVRSQSTEAVGEGRWSDLPHMSGANIGSWSLRLRGHLVGRGRKLGLDCGHSQSSILVCLSSRKPGCLEGWHPLGCLERWHRNQRVPNERMTGILLFFKLLSSRCLQSDECRCGVWAYKAGAWEFLFGHSPRASLYISAGECQPQEGTWKAEMAILCLCEESSPL